MRYLWDALKTSPEKHLLRDVFETWWRGHKKDIFFEMHVLKTSQKRRLFWDVSERSFRCLSQWRYVWDISKTPYAGWEQAFRNKQKWLNKELIIWSRLPGKMPACLMGQPCKMINFFCKKISDCIETSQSAFYTPSQLGKRTSPLQKMPVKVGQPVLGLHIFRKPA